MTLPARLAHPISATILRNMTNLGRVISVGIAVVCVGGTAFAAGGQEAMAVGLGMALCIVFIWWGEELGSLTGNVFGMSYITDTTPGIFVRLFGWALMLAMVAALIVSGLRSS